MQHVQLEARAKWDLEILISGISGEHPGSESLVLAKPLRSMRNTALNKGLRWINLREVTTGDMFSVERTTLQCLRDRCLPQSGKLSSMTWIDEALEWACNQLRMHPRLHIQEVEQLTASSRTALFRVVFTGGKKYWIKAGTRAEYERTTLLAQWFPEYLPRIIAVQDEWNAWLMEDAGNTAEALFSQSGRIFQNIGRRIAELQIQSVNITDELRAAGYPDQSLGDIRRGLSCAMPVIEDAMSTQDLNDVPRLGSKRFRQIEETIAEICSQLDEVGIADGLLHNDLHFGNILVNAGKSVFTDWADAGIGHPFLVLEQLRKELICHSKVSRWIADCTEAYLAAWHPTSWKTTLVGTVDLISPIAIATELCNASSDASATITNSRQQRHIRSLTRELDGTVRSFEEQKQRLA